MDPTPPPLLSPPPAPPPGGIRLGFDAWNWRNWLLGAAVLMALISGTVFVMFGPARDPGEGVETSVAQAVGAYIGSLVCVGFVPGVLLLLSRVGRDGRRGGVLHTAAAVVAVCLAVVQLGTMTVAATMRARVAASKERARVLDEMKDLGKEIAEKNERGEVKGSDLDRIVAASDKAADTMKGADKPLSELMRRFNAHLIACVRPVVAAQEELMKLGGFSIDAQTTKESLGSRAAVAKANQKIAADATVAVRGLGEKLDELAKSLGVSEEKAAGYKRGALGNGMHEKLIRVRELDTDIYRHAERYLTILHDNFGKWRFTDEGIVFDDDATLAAFNDAAAKQSAAANEQLEVIGSLQTKPGGLKMQEPAGSER